MFWFLLALHFTLALTSQAELQQGPRICPVYNPLLITHIESCVPPRVSPIENGDRSDEASSPPKTWKAAGLCRGVRVDKFCVFTNPSFNQGEGVSVITSGKSMATIATRPAFHVDEKEQRSELSSKPTPPYREVEFEGKGKGLVATRAIRAGEIIMARTPAIMVNEKAIQVLGKKAVSELLDRAVEDLPFQHRESLLALSTHTGARDDEKVYKILQTNSFRTGYHDGVSPFYSVFTEVSRLNHDCRPTCAYYFDHTDFYQKVLAVRDIMAGEELTIAYYDPLQPHSTRQEKLKKEWGFQCSCQRCSANASSIAESDARVAQIHRLWKELDDHSATSGATPEKAELLVSLYEHEGLLGRVSEAYYRAAIEYIGIGDTANATKYATLCAEHGLLFIGPDRPFIKDMQGLVANPTRHPKWRFRLRAS